MMKRRRNEYKSVSVQLCCLLALLFAGGLQIGYCQAAPKNPECWAFIRNGALVVSCSGKVHLTSDLHLEGFAVSKDGTQLALKRSREMRVDENMSTLVNESKLVDLRTNHAQEIPFYPHELASSCGDLIGFDAGKKSNLSVATGAVLSRPPYTTFRCSADGRVTAGYVLSTHTLVIGYPPREIPYNGLSGPSSMGFDVSPDGNFSAYADDAKLCVLREGASPQCVKVWVTDPISISNTGDVLFTGNTGKGCDYRDTWHFAIARNGGGNDECLGIFRWHIGMKDPELLEPIGRSPQWIHGDSQFLRSWLRKGATFKPYSSAPARTPAG